MNFSQAKDNFYNILGDYKVMTIATSQNNKPSIRNISAIIIDRRIFFKTDINFKKTKQLLNNENVAMAYHGISFEGKAINRGLLDKEENKFFVDLYNKYFDKSYNSYYHLDSEILIEIVPLQAEVWDQDEEYNGFQMLIDFENKEAKRVDYD
ncbi:MAG: pyridoxamine 5'-phosphate oxidase family protein [Erysipelotrichales bacterium]